MTAARLLRLVVLALAVLVVVPWSVHYATAAGDHTAGRYRLRSGDGMARLVLRDCDTEDDFGAGLVVVDYGDGRAVLRCRHH